MNAASHAANAERLRKLLAPGRISASWGVVGLFAEKLPTVIRSEASTASAGGRTGNAVELLSWAARSETRTFQEIAIKILRDRAPL